MIFSVGAVALSVGSTVRSLEHIREGDALARLGGDEFAIFLEDAGHDDAADVAVKLRTALTEPFVLDGVTLHISVSVGISLFPDDGPDLSVLLRKADIAMYKAKSSGHGHHVLSMALDQATTWKAGGHPLTISVNLSASSLVDADLPEQVAVMLAARGVPPNALQLEITEDFLVADRDLARSILTRLRQDGVPISVDDFGTGHSSLAYLRDLPVDDLKLDRSFIFPMADDARAAALVASTITLAHSLGLRMVAEGVETEVAYTELARLGCDEAQGYFISRPVPAAELDYWPTTRHIILPQTTPEIV